MLRRITADTIINGKETDMYAIAINGSPRKGGNTETLLKAALAPLTAAGWETELVRIGGKLMRGCLACNKCFERQDKKCIQTEDSLNEVLAKILRAQAVIIGSPTYFTDVSAETKALLDRVGYVSFANGRLLRGKIGAAVVAVRRGGGTHVYDTINHMYLMSQMIVPGSTYWNLGYGLDRGDVAGDAEGLANMDHLGRTIAWLGKVMEPHLADFPAADGGKA